jgi:lysophospholipase L1-like esterase
MSLYTIFGTPISVSGGETTETVNVDSIYDLKTIGAKIISGDIKTVSLIGDSSTDGGAGTGYNGSATTALSTNTAGYCWANMLKAYLGKKYGTVVTNYGMYGSGISQQYSKLDTTVPAGTDLVIWLTGTNDRNNTNNGVGYSNVLKNGIKKILENAKYLIVMDGVTALEGNENDHTHSMQEMADLIIPVVHEAGCKFLPMYNKFNEYFVDNNIAESDMSDYFDGYGIHPNDAGYHIMLNIILRELGIPVAYYDDLSVTGDYYPFS